jgi:sigma-E factor negative regulatory protein RseB
MPLLLFAVVSVRAEGEPPVQTFPPIPEQSPEALLQRMTEAQRLVEYEGTLVYLHGGELATLRIAHRIDNGLSQESLLALSGPIRAVARNERGVTCMLSGARSFSVPRAHHGSALLRSVPRDFERIREHYLLQMLGQSRVAGRDTDVVGIVPLDEYRYGYRFFVDRQAGLPLKIDLMDDKGDPIEQVMFTNIEIFDADDPANARAGLATEPSIEPERLSSPAASGGEPSVEHSPGWRLTAMPPGFDVVSRSAQPAPETRPGDVSDERPDRPADRPGDSPGGEHLAGPNAIEASILEHLVVSDGIATVSVYVEPGAENGLDGVMRMGAITAVGSRIGAHHATVVGEVPERTARMLLDGLTPPAEGVTDR